MRSAQIQKDRGLIFRALQLLFSSISFIFLPARDRMAEEVTMMFRLKSDWKVLTFFGIWGAFGWWRAI